MGKSNFLFWRSKLRRRATSGMALAVFLLLASVGCRFPERLAHLFGKGPTPGPRAVMGGGWIEPEALADDGWVRELPAVNRGLPPTALATRWRHPKLDDLFGRPDYSRPDLSVHLGAKDPIVAANAAIGLARWGDARASERLVLAASSPQLEMRLRQAAIEALSEMRDPSPVPAMHELLHQYGHYPPTGRQAYSAELHVELLLGLARHVDASDDGCFVAALRNPNAEVRATALAVWTASRVAELPLEAIDLRADPQATIRAAALTALAERHHPQTLEFARGGLADFELVVRQAAVQALAHAGEAGQSDLVRLLADDSEVLRADAVTALGKLGAYEALMSAAGDASWRVRKNVAQALAQHADRESAGLLLGYLSDPSAEVRQSALVAVEQWPLAQAGPLLLSAIDGPVYQARQQATEQLARRWPAARSLSSELPADRRPQVIEQLRTQWTMEFGQIDTVMLAAATNAASGRVVQAAGQAIVATEVPLAARPAMPPEQRAHVIHLLGQLPDSLPVDGARPAAYAELEMLGGGLVDVLEQLVMLDGAVLPEVVYRDLLPRRVAEFAMLAALRDDDLDQRRRQAARLAERAVQTPLRPLVVVRLATIGVEQTDALVWRSMLAAVEQQAIEPALVLTYAALSHPSAEVRRLAVAALGRRADPRHMAVLLPALSDPHVNVVREAIEALSQPGVLADPRPLEALLAARDRQIRFDAARALVRIGAPSGPSALERMAWENEPDIRRRAAIAMGESGQTIFIPTLIGLLDQGYGIQREALAALTKIVGHDVSLVAGEPLPGSPDRVARWRTWWQQHAQGAAPITPAAPSP